MQRNKVLTILLSLIIAIGLWVYVVSTVTPDDSQWVYRIPVTFTNEDGLFSDRNLVLASGRDATVNLRFNGKRRDLLKLNNTNVTVTTHLPRLRMIISLRVEASLYNYRRQLSELTNGCRGYVLESASDYFGEPYDGTSENKYVAVYPEYYTTWVDPDRLIPFEQALLSSPVASRRASAAASLSPASTHW